jgi:2-keto-4-pentenoate hydratase/2-oxohepta-3-ene-1,7-dioic acid hydratase in catechol pathway
MTIQRFVRFRQGAEVGFGRLVRSGGDAGDGEVIEVLDGDPLRGPPAATGARLALSAVQLLAPCLPPKILAVGRNYRSHLGTRPAPTQPELFWKPVSALQDPGGPIVLPPESTDVHFEGELVLVIGRTLKHADRDQARAGIFGVTCGNDVSERQWQAGPSKDLQWWRAKGSDTFAPCGPVIAVGLDPDQLPLRTLLNGEVVQQQTTADLLFDCLTVVSYASRFVTLTPGDLIFTGTPGSTRKLGPGDRVEVEIEGIGTLANPVVATAT